MKNVFRNLVLLLVHGTTRLLLHCHIILARYEHAFGHQAWNLEYIARLYFRLHGRHPRIVAFQRSHHIPNLSLYQHHLRSGIRILGPDNLLARLFRAARTDLKNRQTTASTKNQTVSSFLYCRFTMDQLHTDLSTEGQQVAYPFSADEAFCGADHESRLTPGDFFCFQDRTTKYKAEIAKDMPANFIHDNRFDLARNTKLDDLYPAIDAAAKKGLTAVRLGVSPEHPAEHDNIFDYASDGPRNNGGNDLFLMSRCKFFLGPNSGIWLLARSQNKPTCLVNVFPWPWINMPLSKDCLVMPKKIWLKEQRRLMTINEMAQMEQQFKWKLFYQDTSFHNLGIEVIDNTVDELTHALVEMNERIDGAWTGSSFRVADVLTNENIAKPSEALFPSFFVLQNPELFPTLSRKQN